MTECNNPSPFIAFDYEKIKFNLVWNTTMITYASSSYLV